VVSFTPQSKSPNTRSRGDWVSPRAGMGDLKIIKYGNNNQQLRIVRWAECNAYTSQEQNTLVLRN